MIVFKIQGVGVSEISDTNQGAIDFWTRFNSQTRGGNHRFF